MCAAGGSVPEWYWVRLPLYPYEVVGGCGESLVGDDITYSFGDKPLVGNPCGSVPHEVVGGDLFDGDVSAWGGYQLTFSDTREDRYFPFLAQVAVGSVFLDRDTEHAARGLAVEVFALAERL